MYYLRRITASIIDNFIIGIVLSIYFVVTKSDIPDGANLLLSIGQLNLISVPFYGWFIGIFYHGIFESSSFQASLGKMFMSLKVVTNNGNKLSLGVSMLRNVNKFLSSVLFLAGYILIFVRKDNRALHDWFSDVKVIDE